MAKQPAEYKNCDNCATNILQYVDVYIRIQSSDNRILSAASKQAREDGPTDAGGFRGPESAPRWSSTQLQIQVLHEENEVKNDNVKERMSGAFAYRIVRKVIGALAVLACCGTVHAQANPQATAQERRAELNLRSTIESPATPERITPPIGNVAYLHGLGVGTQGYVCLPTANGGVSWTVNNARPEATLFTKVFGEAVQIITHFLSPVENPNKIGPNPPRFADVTWQSSFDSSRVWAQKFDFIHAGDDLNSCPNTGSIDCLLLQTIGTDEGPTGGKLLTKTTFIQRLNTRGGSAPTNSCLSPSEIGKQILVPYSADYFFFRAE